MTNLVKENLYSAVAQSIYREITSRNAKYYYFLGGTTDDDTKQINSSVVSELKLRDKIVLLKSLNPTDVSMVVPRIDWVSGEIYDHYDDSLGTQLVGVNIIDVGLGYLGTPDVEFSSGSGASFETTLNVSGSVNGITVVNRGQYYTPAATVSVTPSSGGTDCSVSISVPTSGADKGKVFLTIDNPGSGYVTPPIITITPNNGTGAEGHVVMNTSDGSIKEVIVDFGGNGYEYSPTVLFTGVAISGVGRSASAEGVINKTANNKTLLEDSKFYVVTDEYKVYKCIDNKYGSQSTVKPINIGPSVFETSDGYAWKFLYRIPPNMVSKFVTPDYIPVINALSDNFYDVGSIGRLNIESSGVNYGSDTRIRVSGDGFLRYNPFIITSASLISGGSSYSGASTISFDPPITGDYKEYFSPGSITVNIGEFLKYKDKFYEVVKSGVITTTATDHPAFNITMVPEEVFSANDAVLRFVGEQLKADLVVSSGQIVGVNFTNTPRDVNGVLSYGFGYTKIPNYEISTPGSGADIRLVGEKTDATITPVISNGNIVDYIIVDGGIGYTFTNVSVTSSTGSGAVLSANVYIGNIDTLEANNLLAQDAGGIHNIKLTSYGMEGSIGGISYGYNNTPSGIPVVITGDGVDCEARAIIDVDRKLQEIVIDNPGKGYTYATVTIPNTSDIETSGLDTVNYYGTGAAARAIISPFGGHGRDNIKELFAKRVMTYSKLSNEKFSGFEIKNDFRFFGLIKNPKSFDDKGYVNTSLATACYIVYCNYDQTKFTKDSIVVLNKTVESVSISKRYKIIDTVSGAMILLDMDNYQLSSGDILQITQGSTVTKTEIVDLVKPTFGKHTGELLNVDYRESAFSSTAEQSIVVRTILGWNDLVNS